MVFEKLFFPSAVEMAGARELIKANFPQANVRQIASPDQSYCLDVDIPIRTEVFFKWAVRSNVIIYCYTLSMEMFEPPMWMQMCVREMEEEKKLLGEGDQRNKS